MKMIQTPSEVAANQYASYIHNCLRNPACEPSWGAPLPAVSTLQLYADFGDTFSGSIEFTLVNLCTGATEQIVPAEYVVGQTPELNYYGVFKAFNNPVMSLTSFVVHLSAGGKTFFSEMLIVEPCAPLMKVKSCHPRTAIYTGFDINGIYYGLPFAGASLGDDSVRYFHIAYVRRGKVKDMGAKATFKSSVYFNFRTTIEKIYQFEPGELVPKWFKDVLLAIYSRGAISFDDGPAFIVSDINFTAINDDDLQWKAFAQLKETFKLYYGCDDGICEECCSPSVISADATAGGVVCCDPELIEATAETIDDSISGSDSDSGSEPAPSESDPGESESESDSEPAPGALRLIFSSDQSANTLFDWNTLFDTGAQADTAFNNVIYSAGGTIVDLFGHTNLQVIGCFDGNTDILEMIDFSNEVIAMSGTFNGASNFTNISVPACLNFQVNTFRDCTSLVTVEAPLVTNANAGCFSGCSALVSIFLPACTAIDNSCFAFCSSIQVIDLPVCTSIINGFNFREIGDGINVILINTPVAAPYGGTSGDDLVFFFTSGQIINITLPTSETGDPDIISVSGPNFVTLNPV